MKKFLLQTPIGFTLLAITAPIWMTLLLIGSLIAMVTIFPAGLICLILNDLKGDSESGKEIK